MDCRHKALASAKHFSAGRGVVDRPSRHRHLDKCKLPFPALAHHSLAGFVQNVLTYNTRVRPISQYKTDSHTESLLSFRAN